MTTSPTAATPSPEEQKMREAIDLLVDVSLTIQDRCNGHTVAYSNRFLPFLPRIESAIAALKSFPPTSHQSAPSDESAIAKAFAGSRDMTPEERKATNDFVMAQFDSPASISSAPDETPEQWADKMLTEEGELPLPPRSPDGAGTPTPETDALSKPRIGASLVSVVPADFARKLEQQRDALKAELEEAREDVLRGIKADARHLVESTQMAGQLAQAQRERDEAKQSRENIGHMYSNLVKAVEARLDVSSLIAEPIEFQVERKLTAASQEVEGLKNLLNEVIREQPIDIAMRRHIFNALEKSAARSATPEEKS